MALIHMMKIVGRYSLNRLSVCILLVTGLRFRTDAMERTRILRLDSIENA
jgi:hypothetical protein